MLTESAGGSSEVFEAATGRLLQHLLGSPLARSRDFDSPEWPTKFAVAETGRSVVVYPVGGGAGEGPLRLGAAVRLGDTPDEIVGAAFGRYGTVLAVAGRASVSVWDLTNRTKLLQVATGEPVVSLSVEEMNGEMVGALTSSGRMRLWDLKTLKEKEAITPGKKPPARRLAASSDGRRVVVSSSGYSAEIWDADQLRRVAYLEGYSGHADAIAFSPDDSLVAASGPDDTGPTQDGYKLRLWDATTGRLLRTVSGGEKSIREFAFSPDGRYLAVLGEDEARVLRPDSGSEVSSFKLPPGAVIFTTLAFSRDGTLLAVGGRGDARDGPMLVAKVETGEVVRYFRGDYVSKAAAEVAADGTLRGGNRETVRSIEFSADRRRLLSASDVAAQIWDIDSGELVAEFWGMADVAEAASFTRDGERVIARALDGTVLIFPATAAGMRDALCRELKRLDAARGRGC